VVEADGFVYSLSKVVMKGDLVAVCLEETFFDVEELA